MSFVVYHIKSTQVHKTFSEESSAKRSTTCINRRYPGKYAYASREAYDRDVVKMVERVNLISGQKYMEPSNTPHYCSPSSETYWSM